MGTALITGASAGLGAEYARQLAARGHALVLVARRQDRLEELARELRSRHGVGVEVLAADLAMVKGRAAVAARLRAAEHPVGLLVNNAGFGLGQAFVGGNLRREQAGLDVMVRAVLELSHAAAAGMVERGRGAILNVSSMTASSAMGTYAAHKAWVRTFTEALAQELAGTGVTATAVMPGLVHTEFHEVADMGLGGVPEFAWLPAARVVRESLQAVGRGRVLVTPSIRYQAVEVAMRLLPRAVVRRARRPRPEA
ncbi:SDR family NAD(P)-dependent oxidoreductase [Buchananella felis]|uniref:SDR family NAD(P)-dependent oxidoreductase n=1 Tax=Buchananella felis TaxID=3231492 RepID=UPI0035278148